MSKIPIVIDEPTSDSEVSADVSFVEGAPQGLSLDLLGGFEFRTDTLLFQDEDPDTLIDIEGWYIALEDDTGLILLESGQNLLLEQQA